MAKTKKAKNFSSGRQFSKQNQIVNKNPILRKTRENFISELKDLREEILDECMDQVYIISEEVERKLVYDNKYSNLTCFKYMAKKKPEQYLDQLIAYLLYQDKGYDVATSRFVEILESRSSEKLPNIIEKASLLRKSSLIITNLDFHRILLSSNMNIIRQLLYDELDEVCKLYLESYTIDDKTKDHGNNIENLLESDKECTENNNGTIFKMRSYKELNYLAEKNGFVFTRQKGDHAIFTNTKGYITVIPQKSIGKGLQNAILKQIGEC